MNITLAKILLSAVFAGTLAVPAAFAVNPSEPDAETVEMLTGEVVIPDEIGRAHV